MAGMYGAAAVTGLIDGYDVIVGLWMNEGRAQLRWANRVRAGVDAAFQERLGPEWHAACSDSEGEGLATYHESQAEAGMKGPLA